MRIIIETVPHNSQRYETVGDYFTDDEGTQYIKISDMGNEDYEFLVAIHELVESKLCASRGINNKAIDEFDIKFEGERSKGDESEPGDSPEAPYQNEHNFATGIERLMCAALGIKWQEYDKAVREVE